MVSRARGGLAAFGWTALVVVALIAPIVGLVVAVLLVPDGLQSTTVRPAPLTLPVTVTPDSRARAVQASLRWSHPPPLRAPTWTGVVTAVFARRGELLVDGSPVLSVNGTEALAVQSALPFYRPLALRDVGPDVTALREVLTRLGFGTFGLSPVFDSPLKFAVKQLDARLAGVPLASASGTFEPAWFLYMQHSSLRVGAVHAAVGEQVPQQGEPVVSPSSVLLPFRLPINARGGSAYDLVLSTGAVVRLGRNYTVSGQRSLLEVATSVPSGSPALAAEIRLRRPERVESVPSSAVVTSATGSTCLFTFVAGRLTPLAVSLTSGLPGETDVTNLPASVSSVVANPAQLGLIGCQ
jgi:hypothetical protein